MKLELRYILCTILVSIGFLIWFRWPSLHPLGTVFICAQLIILQSDGIARPKLFEKIKWKLGPLPSDWPLILGLVLFFILMQSFNEGTYEDLLGSWYFTGTLWFGLLSSNAARYFEEKKKAKLDQASP